MAENITYFNGQFVPDSECRLHHSDSAIRRGDSIYDMERTFNGKIDRLRDHMERLYRSLNYVRIDPGLTLEEMEELTLEVVKRNEPMREAGGGRREATTWSLRSSVVAPFPGSTSWIQAHQPYLSQRRP